MLKEVLCLWRRMTTKKQKQIPFGDDNQKGKGKGKGKGNGKRKGEGKKRKVNTGGR